MRGAGLACALKCAEGGSGFKLCANTLRLSGLGAELVRVGGEWTAAGLLLDCTAASWLPL